MRLSSNTCHCVNLQNVSCTKTLRRLPCETGEKKRGYHFEEKKGLIFCVQCYKRVKEDEETGCSVRLVMRRNWVNFADFSVWW